MRFRPLCAATARALGMPPVLVKQIGLRLQVQRIIGIGGRGPGGKILEPRECAALILAILATDRPCDAVVEYLRFADLPCGSVRVVWGDDPDPLGTVTGVPEAWETTAALPVGHRLVDLVGGLFDDAAAGRMDAHAAFLPFIGVRTEQPLPIARLQPIPAGRSLIDDGSAVGQALANVAPSAIYSRPLRMHDGVMGAAAEARVAHAGAPGGGLTVERSISLAAIFEIAKSGA